MIYFDNASTSFPKPVEVPEAMFGAVKTLGSPGRGSSEPSLRATRLIYETRIEIAELFNLRDPLYVSFTQNATESLNAIISTLINKNDHVITTNLEHNSVLRPLYKLGCPMDMLFYSSSYTIDYKQLENLLKPNTKAIICTHASNVTGDILDISVLGKFTKKNNLLFILDVSQTAGYLDINMERDKIDIICFTGHKSLFGPQGTGGICINPSKKISLTPFKSGGSGSNSLDKKHPNTMPDCFEAGTQNSHSIAGLLAGLKFIKKVGIDNIYKKENFLTELFYQNIKDLPNIKVYGSFISIQRCPIVSFNIAEYDSEEIANLLLEKHDISCRAGILCTPLIHNALKTEKQGIIRFSFSYFNNEDEIKKGICAISDLCKL